MYGHSLENILSLSILEQFFNINYKIPLLSDPIRQYYLIQGGWINENLYSSLQSKIINFNVARYCSCLNDWQYLINLNWYINNYRIEKNNLSNTIMLICPGIGINRIRQHCKTMSCWENSQRYSINISTKYWFSDVNFIIVQAQNVWIRTFFRKNRVLIRNNFSWMKTDSMCMMPSIQCFFTKDHGIRGYKCKIISPFGYLKYTKLIITTLEYQYNVFGKWWSVVFLDFGEIANTIRWKNFKAGIGIGIRWQLPIGPIKLDIAIPLVYKIKIDHNFLNFYINLGPEL